MCIIIAQTPQSIEFFLAGRVPERELNVCVVDEDVVDVVFEDGGLVDCWEVAAGEDVEEGGFAAGAVAEEDELALEGFGGAAEWHCCCCGRDLSVGVGVGVGVVGVVVM